MLYAAVTEALCQLVSTALPDDVLLLAADARAVEALQCALLLPPQPCWPSCSMQLDAANVVALLCALNVAEPRTTTAQWRQRRQEVAASAAAAAAAAAEPECEGAGVEWARLDTPADATLRCMDALWKRGAVRTVLLAVMLVLEEDMTDHMSLFSGDSLEAHCGPQEESSEEVFRQCVERRQMLRPLLGTLYNFSLAGYDWPTQLSGEDVPAAQVVEVVAVAVEQLGGFAEILDFIDGGHGDGDGGHEALAPFLDVAASLYFGPALKLWAPSALDTALMLLRALATDQRPDAAETAEQAAAAFEPYEALAIERAIQMRALGNRAFQGDAEAEPSAQEAIMWWTASLATANGPGTPPPTFRRGIQKRLHVQRHARTVFFTAVLKTKGADIKPGAKPCA